MLVGFGCGRHGNTGLFFLTDPPQFQHQKTKIANQPIPAAVSVNPFFKEDTAAAWQFSFWY